jgi:hypothetical protein
MQATSEDNMTEKIKLLKRTGIFLLITGTLFLAYRPTAHITKLDMLGDLMLLLGMLLYWCIPQYIAKEVAKRIIKRTGIIFLITGYLLLAYGSMAKAIHILGAPMLLAGAFLYWRSRQYTAKEVAKRVITDSKPDVLYLRSFKTDPSFGATAIGLISGWLTEEEQLGEVLQPFGDFVAIGKPGETLPTPGAARLYTPDAEWKTKITDQIQTARLTVIRAGTSEGLLWELKEVVQVVNPKKLLILILSMGKKDYESFRKEADRIFNAIFPKFHDLKRFGTISGFFRFSSDWSPNFLPLRAPSLAIGYKPYCTLFTFTLRPVFEEYGLEWKPPPRVSKLVLWLGIGIGICVLCLLALVLLANAMDYWSR